MQFKGSGILAVEAIDVAGDGLSDIVTLIWKAGCIIPHQVSRWLDF